MRRCRNIGTMRPRARERAWQGVKATHQRALAQGEQVKQQLDQGLWIASDMATIGKNLSLDFPRQQFFRAMAPPIASGNTDSASASPVKATSLP
jgi:hypothetical protein